MYYRSIQLLFWLYLLGMYSIYVYSGAEKGYYYIICFSLAYHALLTYKHTKK